MWPPDVFAVAATLVDRSGCYAELQRSGDGQGQAQTFSSNETDHKAYLATVDDASRAWRKLDTGLISGYWRTLLEHQDAEVSRAAGPGPDDLKWRSAAMLLMAIADQTSHGIGFPVRHDGNPFARMIMEEYRRLAVRERTVLPAPTGRSATLCRSRSSACSPRRSPCRWDAPSARIRTTWRSCRRWARLKPSS